MKHLFRILLAMCTISAGVTAQNCTVPQILREEYDVDVKHLTLLRMDMFNAPELNLVQIPAIWQDTIWEGLAAIFNSNSLAKTEVFDEYCVHHRTWTSQDYLRITNSMHVKLDKGAAWYQNWANGDIISGNSYLDTLTQRYGFDQVTFPFSNINVFLIRTTKNLNLKALEDSLEQVPGIIYAEIRTDVGGGDEISYTKAGNERRYDFTVAWGDCPSGCTYKHRWSFSVDPFCNVTFLGESGSTSGIPEPINCNISSVTPVEDPVLLNVLKLYPNPVNDLIKIGFPQNGDVPELRYTIFSVLGKMVREGFLLGPGEIDLSTLQSGVYWIIFENTHQRQAIKLLKN